MQKKDANNILNIGAIKNTQELCPFTNVKCIKISKTDLGICSYCFKNVDQVICPKFFNKTNFIEKAANIVFSHSNFKVLKEVKYKTNYFDFIVVDANEDSNFFVIELQTLDTCGSYKHFYNKTSKPLSINWKTTEKNLISQIIEKSTILNEYNSKLVVVVQNSLYEYMNLLESDKTNGDVIFQIYENKNNELLFRKTAYVSLGSIKNRFNIQDQTSLLEIINNNLK